MRGPRRVSDERESAGAFWRTSLGIYRRAGVSRALIALQERHGADVNLLLYCCWVALSGRGCLRGVDLRRVEAVLVQWRDGVTGALRAVRDRIKGEAGLWALKGAPEVRDRVLDAEIASERVAQDLLEGMAGAPGRCRGGREDARANLDAYLALLGVQPDETDRAHLETILSNAFTQGPPSPP